MKRNICFLFQMNVSSSEYRCILYITHIYTQVCCSCSVLAKNVQCNIEGVTGNNIVALTRHYSSDEQEHQMMHQKNDDTRKTMSTLMASTHQMIQKNVALDHLVK